MIKAQLSGPVFEFTGGRLCLDFANTVYGRPTKAPRDYMKSYGDLVSWARQGGLIDVRDADRLVRPLPAHPDAHTTLFGRAVALREAIYLTFSRLAAREDPRPDDIEILNQELAQAMMRPRIVRQGSTFLWAWDDPGGLDGRVLYPVVRSGAELLTSTEHGALRECAADNCGWLFMDGSRNQSRRWCDMKTCGNRAKVRRYHERARTLT